MKNENTNATVITRELIQWIRDYFDNSASPETKAVIGISGGKDSTIVAKLCVEALGKDRVHGVFLPYGNQANLGVSKEIVDYLGITHDVIDIKPMADAMVQATTFVPSNQAEVNLLPRLRMTALYWVSQSLEKGGRVSNNCNLSEIVMGYSTMWGDNVGDFSPLKNLTVTEVVEVGHALGLPADWVDVTPQDDLNIEVTDGVERVLSDEDVLGVSYEAIDHYIRTGEATDIDKEIIDNKARWNMFKREVVHITAYCPPVDLYPTYGGHKSTQGEVTKDGK